MASKNFIFPKIITSRSLAKSTVYLMENEIFKIEIEENSQMTKEDIEVIQPIKLELTENKPHCVLFIMPRFGNVTKEGREYSASPEANINAVAKAVIAPNLGMRIVANFFIARNKPAIPHKVFTQHDDAINWLLEQKNKFVLKNIEKVES